MNPISKLENTLGEERLVDDSLFDDAYDSVESWKRGIIKKSIALSYKWHLFRLHNREMVRWEGKVEDYLFGEERRIRPCVALFLSNKVDSPSQIISLILPPRLLGIKDLFVFGLYEENWPKVILLTLELLGVDRVYFLEKKDIPYIVSFFTEARGTVWSLVSPEEKGFFSSVEGLHEIFFTPVRGAILACDIDKFNLDEITFSHPSLSLVKKDSFRKDEYFDVIYQVKKGKGRSALGKDNYIPIFLGPGYESLWLWPFYRFFSLFYFVNWAY